MYFVVLQNTKSANYSILYSLFLRHCLGAALSTSGQCWSAVGKSFARRTLLSIRVIAIIGTERQTTTQKVNWQSKLKLAILLACFSVLLCQTTSVNKCSLTTFRLEGCQGWQTLCSPVLTSRANRLINFHNYILVAVCLSASLDALFSPTRLHLIVLSLTFTFVVCSSADIYIAGKCMHCILPMDAFKSPIAKMPTAYESAH